MHGLRITRVSRGAQNCWDDAGLFGKSFPFEVGTVMPKPLVKALESCQRRRLLRSLIASPSGGHLASEVLDGESAASASYHARTLESLGLIHGRRSYAGRGTIVTHYKPSLPIDLSVAVILVATSASDRAS